MTEKPLESWRQRAAVSEALEAFNVSYMQEVWSKALARREGDVEGALTSARTLLEVVCRHILESANKNIRDSAPLPMLYEETAKVLDIAPSDKLTPVLDTLFTACTQIIGSVGKLRNELGDSHGRGSFGAVPTWRHAELAVNLSGAMATYLAAIWKARQPTVADVLRDWLSVSERGKPIQYSLNRIADDLKDVVAARLRASQLIVYFEERAAKDQLAPATIKKEFGLLRTALGGEPAAAFRGASDFLEKTKVMGSKDARLRRVTHQDVDAVLDYLRDQAQQSPGRKHLDAAEGVLDIVEFATWSGRKLAEILTLRWGDVDFQDKTCKLPGATSPFPVLEKAWQVIEKRRPNSKGSSDKIFPEDRQAVLHRFANAMKALVKAGKLESAHRFPDLRYEAAYRLLEKGHSSDSVAHATGQPPARIYKIAVEVKQNALTA